jgi:hypothetical protein
MPTQNRLSRAESALRQYALAYPEAHEEFPWSHVAVKVKGKVFLFLSNCLDGDDVFSLSVKLPLSGRHALTLPFTSPTGYGLGKSGWVSARFGAKDEVPGAIPTDLAPGECREYPDVPGYEILGILGHGGMGVVYRARQLQANRLVALKMIRAVEHASPTERLRFQIETEAVARLQHPQIVQLYEAGEVRGQPFFSLEFCDGGTLTEQLKKQRPSSWEAAALIETLARAMHYAHLRGVVHRDLKPGNVLLSVGQAFQPDSGQPVRLESLTYKITDFGLAKRIDADSRDVSQSGAIMGTASYMAPEQAAGKVRDTGPAADVYALGALLYECLTGRPPFEGPHHVVLVSVLNDEPMPPSRLGAKAPADLETICLKCLSKEPARRYASAEELANDLRRFQGGRADPGAAGGCGGAHLEVGAAAAGAGGAAGRCRAGAGVAGRAVGQLGGGPKRRRRETQGGGAGSRQGDKGPRLPGEHLPHQGHSGGQHHHRSADPHAGRAAHPHRVCRATGAARRAAGGHRGREPRPGPDHSRRHDPGGARRHPVTLPPRRPRPAGAADAALSR